MISRRSLFGLIPAPFAAGLGLLTTSAEPTEAPESDELAEAAMEYEDRVSAEANMVRLIANLRAKGDHKVVDILMTEVLAPMRRKLANSERDFRARLALARGVSVVVNGRVYTACRSSRGNHLVEPVWVAMLTPADD